LDPKNPGALIGMVASLGDLARLKSFFVALKYATQIEKLLIELKELDPSYSHYAPDRGLGILYDEAPSIISVGSSSKARAAFEAAMAGDSGYPGNAIAYARFLASQGEPAKAKELALKVLTASGDPRFVVEGSEWTTQACEI